MFKLLVSYDCGYSYDEEATAETLQELEPQARTFAAQGLRFVVEDENDELVVLSPIHVSALNGIQSI